MNLRRKSAMHGIGIAGIPNHGACHASHDQLDGLANKNGWGKKKGEVLSILSVCYLTLSENKRVVI